MEIKSKISEIITNLNSFSTEIVEINDEKIKENEVIQELPALMERTIKVISEDKIVDENNTKQLNTLINEITDRYNTQFLSIQNEYYSDGLQKYMNIQDTATNLLIEFKRINYLLMIREKNAVLVGGNGAGKSSFASYLKESMSQNIVVIPAQKFLFYKKDIQALYLTDKSTMRNIQNTNFIGKGKFTGDERNYVVSEYMNELSELFSKLITVIANEQVEEQNQAFKTDGMSKVKREETTLCKVNKLWRALIPDINLELDTMNRTLEPKKKGRSYSINSMSDGEKAMLYYICQVFLAEPNSFIIVDEPETFLNVSNFSRLWDSLEKYRHDCKFIYISHTIDFIASRSNTDMLWCKKFSYPDNWSIERIDDGNLTSEFPKELLSEILGARIPILFCEGRKDSDDYFVYSNLFRDKVVVVPVGGHTQVIQYTKAYNNSPVLDNNCAYGIVDSDLMSAKQILNYKKNNIYTLPFNEIEMIFFTKDVMTGVLKNSFSEEDINFRIKDFTEKFFDKVNEERKIIVRQSIKKYLDNELSNYRINSLETSDVMLDEIKTWLEKLNINKMEEDNIDDLDTVIAERRYEDLLKLSSQKRAISMGLANKALDSEYMKKAKFQMSTNNVLLENIKNKYFQYITFK
ncbi:DUF4435 domain-containing protein [Dellaglioa carnosa]|uniref:AAA family ATPase n=1 Tax=Dellaglioa carnosa TaxID=2995136 RepID=A0ABT4JK10_9LACO|nr:AAA family ATPase [Dellaglioa carnosa]MCZ2490706.1 AAA family ATPase [Dellaglioa carnosa]MCZ2493784.1 AAA family ATPase [Dellaglioa carnosa]MDK1730648.1 AAA family ATPase [Dellaglioa carnosa]